MIRNAQGEALEFLAVAEDANMLYRPCVDCGRLTGRFCDGYADDPKNEKWKECYAAERDPKNEWAPGQRTPLCSKCDNTKFVCHYCRGLLWCTPPQHEKG